MKPFRTFIRSEQGKFSQYTGAEKVSDDKDKPASRFVGTSSLTNVYKSMTPGYAEYKSDIAPPAEERTTEDK